MVHVTLSQLWLMMFFLCKYPNIIQYPNFPDQSYVYYPNGLQHIPMTDIFSIYNSIRIPIFSYASCDIMWHHVTSCDPASAAIHPGARRCCSTISQVMPSSSSSRSQCFLRSGGDMEVIVRSLDRHVDVEMDFFHGLNTFKPWILYSGLMMFFYWRWLKQMNMVDFWWFVWIWLCFTMGEIQRLVLGQRKNEEKGGRLIFSDKPLRFKTRSTWYSSHLSRLLTFVDEGGRWFLLSTSRNWKTNLGFSWNGWDSNFLRSWSTWVSSCRKKSTGVWQSQYLTTSIHLNIVFKYIVSLNIKLYIYIHIHITTYIYIYVCIYIYIIYIYIVWIWIQCESPIGKPKMRMMRGSVSWAQPALWPWSYPPRHHPVVIIGRFDFVLKPITQMLHVWNIYLHLGHFWGKCR